MELVARVVEPFVHSKHKEVTITPPTVAEPIPQEIVVAFPTQLAEPAVGLSTYASPVHNPIKLISNSPVEPVLAVPVFNSAAPERSLPKATVIVPPVPSPVGVNVVLAVG